MFRVQKVPDAESSLLVPTGVYDIKDCMDHHASSLIVVCTKQSSNLYSQSSTGTFTSFHVISLSRVT